MFFNEAYAAGLPTQGSVLAPHWDSLYNFLVGLSIFFFVIVVGAMIYFIFKYRERPGLKAKYITGNHTLEIIWTVIPLILLMVIFGWGYVVYNEMTNPPSDAYEVRVIGKQWLWQFQYEDGRVTTGELYVPANKPVKLVMTSEDVIHSFFVPNFRIKQDVVPGMYTSVWFEATVPGKHQIYCTEYCGASHSLMLGKVIALNEKEWADFKRGKKVGQDLPDMGPGSGNTLGSAPSLVDTGTQVSATSPDQIKLTQSKVTGRSQLAEDGAKLSQTKGCVACHTPDGAKGIGPSFKGFYDSEVELMSGQKVKADDNYIRESIEMPQAKIVKGFGPVMPTFKGMFSETEMNAMIAYIKSLK